MLKENVYWYIVLFYLHSTVLRRAAEVEEEKGNKIHFTIWRNTSKKCRKIHFLGETLTMRTTSVRGGRGGERRKAERRAVGVCGSSSSWGPTVRPTKVSSIELDRRPCPAQNTIYYTRVTIANTIIWSVAGIVCNLPNISWGVFWQWPVMTSDNPIWNKLTEVFCVLG